MKKAGFALLLMGFLIGAAGLVVSCGGGGSGGSDLEPFDISCLPLYIDGTDSSYVNMAFDGDGNLIFPNAGTDEVMFMDRLTCVLSTIATVPSPAMLVSIVYHPGADTIYVGDTIGNIYAVNPSSGASTLQVNVGDFVSALAVAPQGFGSYGGKVIAALHEGTLVAVDTASTATTVIGDVGDNLTDIEFGRSGTLYGTDYDLDAIFTISATGMTSIISSGFNDLDGIAVDEAGGRLFAADSAVDLLYAVQISDGAKTVLGSFDFDDGYGTSGLAYDGVQNLLMTTGETGLYLVGYTP